MLHDIRLARELGADGVVIGCLTADGSIDLDRCGRLREAAGTLDITFHRAFDMARDLAQALEDVHSLGIRRILTSGGQPDVPAGVQVIEDLVRRATGRVSIMPGGGVTDQNLAAIVRQTGVREIHLSARDSVQSSMKHHNQHCSMGAYSKDHEYEWREATVDKVRRAKTALAEVGLSPSL